MNSIRDSMGTAQSLIAISFDLTERKRLEEELARTDVESAKYLEAVSRLHTVATLYVGESTLPAVLDEVVKAAIALADADMGDLRLIDRQSGSSGSPRRAGSRPRGSNSGTLRSQRRAPAARLTRAVSG